MPNSHFHCAPFSRSSKGKTNRQGLSRSVVAAAAYRAGEALVDERTNTTFDYARKEDVIHTNILTPDHAEFLSGNEKRAALWNSVEDQSERKNHRMARSFSAALPRELTYEQMVEMVEDYAKRNFTDHGMIADIALHDKDASDGGRNPHVHMLVTVREIDAEGNWAEKANKEWNKKTALIEWRKGWETATNDALEQAGTRRTA